MHLLVYGRLNRKLRGRLTACYAAVLQLLPHVLLGPFVANRYLKPNSARVLLVNALQGIPLFVEASAICLHRRVNMYNDDNNKSTATVTDSTNSATSPNR